MGATKSSLCQNLVLAKQVVLQSSLFDWRRPFVNQKHRLDAPLSKLSSPPSASAARKRDPLIDLWRGLALVNMGWVHLASYPIGMPQGLSMWVGEYTRFAAGAFVILSGLTIRRVFGPSLEAGGERERTTQIRLVRRALLLVLVGRLGSIAFTILEGVALSPTADRLTEIWHIATFAVPGATGGLLLLYGFLLAATPLISRLRMRAGDVATLAVSLTIFAWAQWAGPAAHWPAWTFPIAHWQALFFGGYIAGPYFDRLRARGGAVSGIAIATISAAYAVLFIVRNHIGLGVDASLVPALDFTKVPLRTAESVWYVVSTLLVMVWSARCYESSAIFRNSSQWIVQLGQWSLLVYVSHLLLELPIIALFTTLNPSPLWRISALLMLPLAMSLTAQAAERFRDWQPPAQASLSPLAFFRRAIPPAGTVGTGVALACLASVMLLHGIMTKPPRGGWSAHVEETAGEEPDGHQEDWFTEDGFDGSPANHATTLVDAPAITPENEGTETPPSTVPDFAPLAP